MKVVIQRVSRAQVTVAEETVGTISRGLLLLVGFGREDTGEAVRPMAEKVVNMRIFPDEAGRFHHSLIDVGGEILAVPQFTLFADTRKGRRPEFFEALEPDRASPMFDRFVAELEARLPGKIQTGRFGAHMQVELVNDGPVTIPLEMF